MRLAVLLVVHALLVPRVATAHGGGAPLPHELWSAWTLDPWIVLLLALGGWGYARGTRALWRRAGRGRGVRRGAAAAFAGGWAALVVALVSPVHAMGEALFWAHMIQHLLLMLVAAPLLALASPLVALIWALPLEVRRGIGQWWRRATRVRAAWRALSHPVVVWVSGAVVLWAWHLPSLYDLAVRNDAVHAVQHASFFTTAFSFWWALAHPRGAFGRARGGAILFIFAAALQSGALGALLALSADTWYSAHHETAPAWGLTPLADQQIGGGIMWLPASFIYLAALGLVFRAWMAESERRVERAEAIARAR